MPPLMAVMMTTVVIRTTEDDGDGDSERDGAGDGRGASDAGNAGDHGADLWRLHFLQEDFLVVFHECVRCFCLQLPQLLFWPFQ